MIIIKDIYAKDFNMPVMSDSTLSLKAKGLFAIIVATPDDELEGMTFENLIYRSADGATATRNAMNELIAKRYVKRRMIRKKNGDFTDIEYSFCDYKYED